MGGRVRQEDRRRVVSGGGKSGYVGFWSPGWEGLSARISTEVRDVVCWNKENLFHGM